MLRLATDEDFNRRIVRALRRQVFGPDLVTVQEAGLTTSPDPDVLRWAADEDRVLLTHEVNTMLGFAYDRVVAGEKMPGDFAVRWSDSIGPQ